MLGGGLLPGHPDGRVRGHRHRQDPPGPGLLRPRARADGRPRHRLRHERPRRLPAAPRLCRAAATAGTSSAGRTRSLPMAEPYPPDEQMRGLLLRRAAVGRQAARLPGAEPGRGRVRLELEGRSTTSALYTVRPFVYFHLGGGQPAHRGGRHRADGRARATTSSPTSSTTSTGRPSTATARRWGWRSACRCGSTAPSSTRHRYDHTAVTTLLLVTTEETQLEHLIARKVAAGDIGAVANTIVVMGSERVGNRLARYALRGQAPGQRQERRDRRVPRHRAGLRARLSAHGPGRAAPAPAPQLPPARRPAACAPRGARWPSSRTVGLCSTFHRFPEGLGCLWEAVVGRAAPRWPRRSHHDAGDRAHLGAQGRAARPAPGVLRQAA